jgi:hypothetical protein
MLLDLVQKSAARAYSSGPERFRDKCVPVTVYLNEVYPYQSVVVANSGLKEKAIEKCVIEGAASVLGLDTLNAEARPMTKNSLFRGRPCGRNIPVSHRAI